jgi:hypothetical protein
MINEQRRIEKKVEAQTGGNPLELQEICQARAKHQTYNIELPLARAKCGSLSRRRISRKGA